ncbi:hypothetical protein GCM10020295_06880 [Streptomyces cinereospinus]
MSGVRRLRGRQGRGGSPGVISGNTVQLPVHVPVNVCGNTVNVVGLLDPAAGNRCANTGVPGTKAPGREPRPAGERPPRAVDRMRRG